MITITKRELDDRNCEEAFKRILKEHGREIHRAMARFPDHPVVNVPIMGEDFEARLAHISIDRRAWSQYIQGLEVNLFGFRMMPL